MPNEKILILGGTGFLGSHLALKSLEKGYHVTVLSLNTPHVSSKINQVTYIQCDIRSYVDLKKIINGDSFDYVVNLGGYVDHRNFSEGGSKTIDAHLIGVINLLKVINLNKLKRFIQIGSSDEYGASGAPQNENDTGVAFSPYSFSKLAVTQLLQMLYKKEQLPIVVIRLFLVYGPGQNRERFLPQIINGCLSKESFPVSWGEQLRDFCYIDDVIRGILLSINSKNALGEIINIASGSPIKIKNLVNMTQKIIGCGKPNYGGYPYRKDENMELYADIQKANKLLKWHPEVDLKEGLEKTIKYFKCSF